MRKLFFLLLLTMGLNVWGASTVIWEGSKTFFTWADVINISGSKFSKVKADDVILFSIITTGDAKLQLSYGTNWTNFDGLEALPITGDYRLVATSQIIGHLKQGIHVKGINYTLKSITVVSNDGTYTTSSEDLFSWDDLLTSGAIRGESSIVNLQAYGGAGWYWPDTKDFSGFGCIELNLLQPVSETLIIQLLYGDTGVKRVLLSKGSRSCKLVLSKQHNYAYSFNIMSEKAQTVAIGSINLLDKQGNISSISNMVNDISNRNIEYYGITGMKHDNLTNGINIVVTETEGGRTITRKIIK